MSDTTLNQAPLTAQEKFGEPGDGGVNLIDLIIVLAKHKKLIVGVSVAAAVLSSGISLMLPSSYMASTKLLPPQQAQSGAAALLSQLGGIAGAAAGAAGIKNPSDLYIGMLRSRTVADKLITKYGLKAVYKTDSQEKARERLDATTAISSGKDGLITIQVEEKDPKLVARLANGYVEELLQLTRVMAVTEASQRRMFFERQLELAKDNLTKAETSLKGALDSRGVISVDAESRAMLETVGRLRAQASAKEIQLSSMRAFITVNNPEYKHAEEELISLRAELSKLENGRDVDSKDSPLVPASKNGIENIKLLRNVKYYEMLYELLSKQYEVARLDEAKDPSIIQVLDPAIDPERRSKPHRAMIVIVATFMAFFAAIALAFISEARLKVLASEVGAARWKELKSHLRFR